MHGTLSDQASIYLQIAQMLEGDILRGIYGAEEQVPSTNELARLYQINPATAAKGLNLLVGEGILYKRRGLGMFVTLQAGDLIREKRRSRFYEEFVRPLVVEGKSLGIDQAELNHMITTAMGEEQTT